jgi:membrane protein implicated in regulation of membrane protease activity
LEGLDIVVWAAVAALAFVGEILTVSFFLLFLSAGALIALLMALLGFGIVFQVVGFVVVSVLSTAILRPALLHRIFFPESEGYESRGGIVGKSGVVTNAIEPDGSGMVRIGNGEFWTARSLYPGQRIEPGARVRVLHTEGLTALVEAVEVEGGEKT